LLDILKIRIILSTIWTSSQLAFSGISKATLMAVGGNQVIGLLDVARKTREIQQNKTMGLNPTMFQALDCF